MANLKQAHDKINSKDWKELFLYDPSSPTCLKWKSPTRAGNKGTPTPRKSLIAGGVSSQGYLVINIKPDAYSIPKIVWVMHNGPIPDGYTIWFADGNPLNAKIENLVLQLETVQMSEKYSEELKEYLEYDETSPSALRWKKRISKSSTIYIGDVAGALDTLDGYWKIHGLGSHYKVHRIVWFMHHGKIPKEFNIDHINGNRQDNRIENLRLVTKELNARNRRMSKNNTSGYNGVTYYEGYSKRGTLVRKYTARVSIKTWTPKSKAFSCLKYGDEEALRLALEWRDKTIKEINEQGAGYTERHGTKE